MVSILYKIIDSKKKTITSHEEKLCKNSIRSVVLNIGIKDDRHQALRN